jgi:hypothetical protein
MHRICLISAICLLWTNVSFAQVEVVSAVKNDLVARGVSLVGPCGAFEITKRVAWVLKAQGIGLLSKPQGNNCQGYSVDFLTRQDGSGLDILGDGGGDNTPTWHDAEPPGALSGRWREPFDPGDGAIVVPPVVTPPGLPTGIEEHLKNIDNILQFDAQVLSKLIENDAAILAAIKQHDEEPMWITKVMSSRYTQIVLAALGTWLTVERVK